MKILLLAPASLPIPAALSNHPHTRVETLEAATVGWDLLILASPLPVNLPSMAELNRMAGQVLVLSGDAPLLGNPPSHPCQAILPADLGHYLAQPAGMAPLGLATDLRAGLDLLLQGLERLHQRAAHDALNPQDFPLLIQLGSDVRDTLRILLKGPRRADEGFVPTDLSSLLRDTAQLLRLAAPPAINVQAQITPGIWVQGQPEALRKALLHLTLNAWDAMPRGGNLTLSLSETSLESAGAPPQRQAFLQIRDTGDGMDPAVAEQAAAPYFSTRIGDNHVGMGLTQAQRTLEAHDGSLGIQSRPGGGTSIDMLMPCLGLGAHLGEDAGLNYLHGTERILLVDPDPMIRELALHGLAPFGYEVTAVSNGQDGLEAFRATPSAFDLVLVELDLPGHGPTGADLGHRIRHLRRDLPIVLLTTLSTSLEAVHSIHGQFTDVLPKPFTAHDLARTIRRHRPAPNTSLPPPPSEAPASQQAETVLLAEDSSVTRGMIRRWLVQAGHNVHEARDGQEAWDLFLAQRDLAPFSMVITDVVMPRMDGLELARRIREADTALPIAVMTTVEDRDTMKLALQAGVNEFLSKPFDMKDLRETVQHLANATQGRREARRSLETAQAVRLAQRALLAVPERDLPIFTLYEPLTDAGGDVFRAQRLADGSIFFVLGDVAGHSVISSYAVAAFLGMLSSFIGHWKGLRHLAERLNQGIQEGPFSEVPVCALLGHWHPDIGRLHLLNAGIPHAAWFEAAHQATRWIPLNGVPLGILDAPVIEERVVFLAEGDRLLLGTDGFLEAMSAERELFADSVPGQWSALCATPVQWALSLVCEAARAHAEGSISDDLLVVGFEQTSRDDDHAIFHVLPSSAEAIDPFCDEIKQLLVPAERDGNLTPARRFEIILAIREALTNAVFHGNHGKPEARIQAFARLLTPQGPLEVRVVDEGEGFDLSHHQPPEAVDSTRGRGIPLLRTCAQHLSMTASELAMTFTLEDQHHD